MQPNGYAGQGDAAISSARTPPPRVIVVGAGVAGLAAAKEIQQSGMEVLVVEARSRIGGRIHTERFENGACVDMGAAWLQGTSSKNPLVPLARECGAKLIETDFERSSYFEAGGNVGEPPKPLRRRVPDEELDFTEAIFDTTWGLWRQIQKGRQKEGPMVQDATLWSDVAQMHSPAFAGWQNLDERQQNILRYFWSEKTEEVYAAKLEELSSTWWNVDSEFGGSMCLWSQGYVMLAEHLAEGIEVRLNSPVVGIRGGVDASGCEVTLASGEKLRCAGCICTLPLGVLKAGKVTFDPPLSDAKAEAILRLGMGLLNKVALRFDRCPWLAATTTRGFEPHQLVRVPIENGRLSPASMEAQYWVSLRPATETNAIVAYFMGDAAREVEERTDGELVTHCLAMLDAMLPGAWESLASIEEVKVSGWAADEFSLGSYSYLPLGARPEHRKALAEPSGFLFFAGEATHSLYPATVHGAYLSGCHAAAQALAALGMREPPNTEQSSESQSSDQSDA